MQIKETEFKNSITKMMTKVRRSALSVPGLALIAFASISPNAVVAATYNIFLIATHTAPAPSTTAAFSVDTTKVYQLGDLNSGLGATSITEVDNFSFDVDAPLTFNNGVSLNPGESGGDAASYINSEISTWDNVNIPSSGLSVATEQLDFGRNSQAIFNPAANGFTDLVIAELGGFNPFEVALCEDALCSTYNRIFSGINSDLRGALFGVGNLFPEFVINDSDVQSEMDQTWLFRFNEPIFDYVSVLEFDNRSFYTNERLEVDFIGTGGGVTTSPVPLPTGLPLMASGLGFLAWTMRRKKS